MKILGINISHHASICLLEDGKVLYHIEEDRFNKKKYWGPYWGPIDVVDLEYLSLQLLPEITNEIDYVVVSGIGEEFESNINKSLYLQLKNLGYIDKVKDHFYFKNNHHIYHSALAFYNSGFDDCAALIIDGGGATLSTKKVEGESIFTCSYPDKFEKVYSHLFDFDGAGKSPDVWIEKKSENEIYSSTITCGSLFNLFSSKLGFTNIFDAGKLMGLSSYGIEETSESWWIEKDGVMIANTPLIYELLNREFPTFQDKANIAKKLQEETKKHTKHLIKKCLKLSDKVVLSGGYFLNCVNNYEYLDLFENTDNLYIEPNSSDAGTSIGAAKLLFYSLTKSEDKFPLKTLYLG